MISNQFNIFSNQGLDLQASNLQQDFCEEMDIIQTDEGILPTKNHPKIMTVFQNNFSLSHNIAKQITDEIFQIQKQLQHDTLYDRSLTIKTNENIPFDVVVTKDLAFCLLKQIGEGTFSLVYEASVIPLKPQQFNGISLSPSKAHKVALKRSKLPEKTYSPEKRMIDKATSPRKRGIDHPISTFKESRGYAFSIHKIYDKTVSQVKFFEQLKPISSIINFLISISQSLNTIHEKGYIHRDIKGGNLLITIANDIQSNAISDFGLLMLQPHEKHKATGTPEYLDPVMFGDTNETLVNQKNRIGMQTKEGDIFALGITTIKDILFPFLKDISKYVSNGVKFNQLIENLSHRSEEGYWEDKDLRKIGDKYPYRVMHRSLKDKLEMITNYPDLATYRELLPTCFFMLTDCLTKDAIDALIVVSHLACDMQEADLQKRISLGNAINTLEALFEKLKNKAEKKSILKRQPSFEDNNPSPQKKPIRDRQSDLEKVKIRLFDETVKSKTIPKTDELL